MLLCHSHVLTIAGYPDASSGRPGLLVDLIETDPSDQRSSRIAVRDHYRRKGLHLEFSFDGNLVGDFGEVCAVEEYGMKLVEARSNAGFDGYSLDGNKTIQVKATRVVYCAERLS